MVGTTTIVTEEDNIAEIKIPLVTISKVNRNQPGWFPMFHLVMEDLIMQTGLVMVGPFLIDKQDRLGLGKLRILENLSIRHIK